MRSRLPAVLVALVSGALAALAVWLLTAFPLRLAPGEPGWDRFVTGARPDGRVTGRATVRLPGLARDVPRTVALKLTPRAVIAVAVDQAPVYQARADAEGWLLVRAPESSSPGLWLEIHRTEAALRLITIEVEPYNPFRLDRAWIAFVFAATLALIAFFRIGPSAGIAAGLFAACLAGMIAAPAALWLAIPASRIWPRLALPTGSLAAALFLGARLEPSKRRLLFQEGAIAAAFVLGTAVRLYFLPSAGSWDTEYWKAWMLHASERGVASVYGEPGSISEGHFLAQLGGEEPVSTLQHRGRTFGVDYPPLAMIAWRVALPLSRALPLDAGEAENVAAKLPALAGDVAALAVLLWGFASTPRRGVVLAALYWVLPVSWLSSAVLGYQDATYAPLAAAALVAAGRSRPVLAGGCLVLASLIKPLAILVTPAIGGALLARRLSWHAWWGAIAGGVFVLLLVLLPFAAAGTLPEVTVHVFRAFFPGNLSSGCANLWWLVGHLWTDAREMVLVPFVRLDAAPFPAAPMGTLLLAAVASWIVWEQRRFPGVGPASLAGAALVFAYAMISVGVYENHPHILFLLLCLTGLESRRLQILAALSAALYLVNLVALAGLGRFYGTRHLALEPLVSAMAALRLGAGVDITLLLAIANLALFAVLLGSLRREMTSLSSLER